MPYSPKFESLSVCHVHGMSSRTLPLDPSLTLFLGPNGAGKTTMLLALALGQVPDASVIGLQSAKDDTGQIDRGVAGRLSSPTIIALEAFNRQGERMLFVTHVTKASKTKLETRMAVIWLGHSNYPPLDLIRGKRDSDRVDFWDPKRMRDEALAKGLKVKITDTVADYCTELAEAGLLPKALVKRPDRARYGDLVRALMTGGLSDNMLKDLGAYLFKPDHSVRGFIKHMHNTLQEIQMFRARLQAQQTQLELFSDLLGFSSELTVAAWSILQKRHDQCAGRLQRATTSLAQCKKRLIDCELTVETEANTLQRLREEKVTVDTRLRELNNRFQQVTTALSFLQQHTQACEHIQTLEPQVEELSTELVELQVQLAELEEQGQLLEEENQTLLTNLSSEQQAVSEESKRRGLYEAASMVNNQAQVLFDADESWDPVAAVSGTAALEQTYADMIQQVNQAKQSLQQAEKVEQGWKKANQLLASVLSEAPELTLTREAAWQLLNKDRYDRQLAANLPELTQTLSDAKLALSEQQAILSVLNTQGLTAPIEGWSELAFIAVANQIETEIIRLQIDIKQGLGLQLTLSTELQVKQQQLELAKEQVRAFDRLSPLVDALGGHAPIPLTSAALRRLDNEMLQQTQVLQREIQMLSQRMLPLKEAIKELSGEQYRQQISQLEAIADAVGGVPLHEMLDGISVEEAAYFEGVLGNKAYGILVSDLEEATERLLEAEIDRPQEVVLIEFSEPQLLRDQQSIEIERLYTDISEQYEVLGEDEVLVAGDDHYRLSRLPKHPMLGSIAREKRREELQQQLSELEAQQSPLEDDLGCLQDQRGQVAALLQHAVTIDGGKPALPPLEKALSSATKALRGCEHDLERYQTRLKQIEPQGKALNQVARLATRLSEHPQRILDEAEPAFVAATEAAERVKLHTLAVEGINLLRSTLELDLATDMETLQHQVLILDRESLKIANQLDVLARLKPKLEHLTYADAEHNLAHHEQLKQIIDARITLLSQRREEYGHQVRRTQEKNSQTIKEEAKVRAQLDQAQQLRDQSKKELSLAEEALGERVTDALKNDLYHSIQSAYQRQDELGGVIGEQERLVTQVQNQLLTARSEHQQAEGEHLASEKTYQQADECLSETELHLRNTQFFAEIHGQLQEWSQGIADSQVIIKSRYQKIMRGLMPHQDTRLYAWISDVGPSDDYLPELAKNAYLLVVDFMVSRINRSWVKVNNPAGMLQELNEATRQTERELSEQEGYFRTEGRELASQLYKRIRSEIKLAGALNKQIEHLRYGNIEQIYIDVQVDPVKIKVIDALQRDSDGFADLFASEDDVESALAQLYARETGGAVGSGLDLLDHRQYLQCRARIRRNGHKNMETFTRNSLSTGEGIGTGLALMVSVMRAWAVGYHGKKPYKLLVSVDEGSRLDADSIATVLGVARQLGIQITMAAPALDAPYSTKYRFVRDENETLSIHGMRARQDSEEKDQPMVNLEQLDAELVDQ